MPKKQDNSALVAAVLEKSPDIFTPTIGDLVEGSVISIDPKRIVIDIQGLATGVILGREMQDNKKTISKLQVGDNVQAVFIDEEPQDGLLLLSLRKASQKTAWDDCMKAHQEGVTISVKAHEANKGGLLVDIDGVKGFLPLSQLAPLHYPRVEGANAERIYQKLQELVGHVFVVKIINVDFEAKKLILSERSAMDEEKTESMSNLKVGQKVNGVISGVVSYGIFVTFNGLEGLVHISEIDWGHVSDPKEYGKAGDPVEVTVIGVDERKISLSMKRLNKDPWIQIAQSYRLNDVVEGTITRVTPFGAFMRLEEGINGLIHLSELSEDLVKDPSEHVEVGKNYKAKIITLDIDERRIGLSLKALNNREGDKKKSKKEGDVEGEETEVNDTEEKASKKKTKETVEEKDTKAKKPAKEAKE